MISEVPTIDDPEGSLLARPSEEGRIKAAGRPGIPVRVELTETEASINDTNKRWRTLSRAGTTGPEQ